jgi:hypothetical protein
VHRSRVLSLASAFFLPLFVPASVPGVEPPPSFTVSFLGEGSVVAINNVGTVVGVRTSATTGVQTPLVSEAGGPWTTLPLPAGASSAFPTDLNDAGVIVGVATLSSGRRAIRWRPAGGGYAVDLLPLLPGEIASYATAINDLDQIVGARAGILGTPYGFGWLYSDVSGLADLNLQYGWFATPSDINDRGVILSGTQTFDLSTRSVSNVGLTGPTNYNAVQGVALNEAGQIAGQASLRSSSLNIVSAYRYTPGAGWLFVAGSSRYTIASSINAGGDMTYSEQAPGIRLEGLGTYALGDLLDPAARADGWVLTGLAPKINDGRVVATAGRNTVTGQAGGLLLTPAGATAPPSAPTGLTAVPHPATRYEPYVSIDLSWVKTDPATRTYELQRSLARSGAWTPVALVPPAMSTFHQDTTVAVSTTYDYRVRAVGVAGPGAWSGIATATSPSQPLDKTAPVVTVTSPSNGATASGTVTVSATATDNVGVDTLQLSYWDPYRGSDVVLGSVTGQGSIAAPWDTSVLTPATYTLTATAIDALGNVGRHSVSVTVTASGRVMRVTALDLSASLRWGRVTVTGAVTVRTPAGAAVPDAAVAVRWTRPDGSTRTATSRTDAAGRALVSTSGTRGTYTLTVTGVTKSGYALDAAGSALSRSITY